MSSINWIEWAERIVIVVLMYRQFKHQIMGLFVSKKKQQARERKKNRHKAKEKQARERQAVLDTQSRARGEIVPERDPTKPLYKPKRGRAFRKNPKPEKVRVWTSADFIPAPATMKDPITKRYVAHSDEPPPMPMSSRTNESNEF